jgi:queuine/archaeosine tRNA-ribosyltransferase
MSKTLASRDSHDFEKKKIKVLFPIRSGREYEDLENTHAKDNRPFDSHLISVI